MKIVKNATERPMPTCPNCTSTKTYIVRPSVYGCTSCSAVWEGRR